MDKYNFWENWENINSIEEKAIKSIIKARELIIKSVPKKALVAIYIKGSFVRREMNRASDVDIVPIVTENKYEGPVFETNIPEIQPACVVPLSIVELKENKLLSEKEYNPDLRAEPDLFVLKLEEYKIIYGNQLNPKEYPTRPKEQILDDEKYKIKNGYIKAYKEGKIELPALIKEFFWLIELEQEIKGNKVKHSFVGIAESVNNKEHIIYDALEIKNNNYTDKTKENIFISKLEKYLE